MAKIASFKAQVWNIRRNGDGLTRYVELQPEIPGRPGEFGNGALFPLTLSVDVPVQVDQVMTVTVETTKD